MLRTLTLLALMACASPAAAQQPPPSAGRTLEIVSGGMGAYVGTTVPLSLRSPGPSASRAASLLATWESSDPTIAWVSDDGAIVYLREGRVTINAHSRSGDASREFVVTSPSVDAVSLRVSAHKARVGDTVRVGGVALDQNGAELRDLRVNLAVAGTGAALDASGALVADRAGFYLLLGEAGGVAQREAIAISDTERSQPPTPGAGLDALEISDPDYEAYAGTTIPLRARARRRGEEDRDAVGLTWATDRVDVATVSNDGVVTLLRPGRVVVTASAGSVNARREIAVKVDPTVRVGLRSDAEYVALGDTVHFSADVWVRGSRQAERPHVAYAVASNSPSPRASMSDDGRFVAQSPGVYTIIAAVGQHADSQTITVHAEPLSR